MGFNTVYQLLMDQFPTVDARVLRAVAIEHSSDANQAFCVVLDEILPHGTRQNAHTIPVRPSVPPPALPVRGPIPAPPSAFPMRNLFAPPPPPRPETITKVAPAPPTQPDWSWSSHNSFGKGSAVPYPIGYPNPKYPPLNTVVGGSSSVAGTSRAPNQSGTNSEKNKSVLSGNNFYKPVTPSSLLKDLANNQKSNTESGFHQSSLGTSKSSSIPLLDSFFPGDAYPLRPKYGFQTREVPVMDMSKFNSPASSTISQPKSKPVSGVQQSGMGTSKSPSYPLVDRFLEKEVIPLSPSNVWRPCGEPIIDMSKMNAPASGTSSQINPKTSPFGAEHVMKTSESQTDQPMSKLLGELIKDAETDKTNMISAMESAVNIMKEVEAKKQEALWAKAEAAGGGPDILAKVEIIQKQLQKLVETNGKLAKEVKESKSTLTTEVSEIQSCLLKLSEEKDKSVDVLDDMRRVLEAQLAAADQELEKAKLMKQQKEANDQKVQAEELALKKAIEEATVLEQAAKENSKVQKLLQDCRYEVDILQRDMDEISRDVKSLKENFDQCIPFSKTSSTLASSISSQESDDSSHSDSFSAVPSLVSSPKKAALESSILSEESEDSSQSGPYDPPRKSPELDSPVSSQESKEFAESESYERLASLAPPLKRSAMDSLYLSQESEDSADSESSDSMAALKSSLNKSDMKSSVSVQDSEDSAHSKTFEQVAPVVSTPKRGGSYSSCSSEDFTGSEYAQVLASHVSSPKMIEPSTPLSTSVMSIQTVASENTEPVSSELSQKSGHSEQAEYEELHSHRDLPILSDAKAPSNSNIVEDGWDLCDGSGSDSDF